MKHFIPDATGHTTIEFDNLDPKQLADANARFLELVQNQKHVAATRQEGASEYTVIRSPDQQQDETLFLAQMRGG